MEKDNSGKFMISASQYLGLILIMSTLFIGTTYWTDGNIVISIPIAIIVSALFFILVNFFIKEKRNMSRGGYKPQTIILFFFYIILAIPASLISIHAINVELFEKDNIKQISKDRISGIYSLDEWYSSSKDSLLGAWEVDMNNHVSNYLMNGVKKNSAEAKLQGFPYLLPVDALTLDNKNEILQMKIEDWSSTFEEGIGSLSLKKEKIIFENTKALKNWNRFTINEKFNKLDDFVVEMKDKMEEVFSENRNELKFDLNPYVKEKTLLNQPIDLFSKHMNPISFALILVMQFLILLPYFLTKKIVYNKKGFFSKSKKTKEDKQSYGSSDEITGTEI